MFWDIPARADTATNFAAANDSIDTIAWPGEDTSGYSVSKRDAAATSDTVAAVNAFYRSKRAWPIVGSGRYPWSRFNSTVGFARHSACSKREPAYAG